MKKISKIVVSLVLVFVALITLASCSNVSQSYADKINNAAEKKEYVKVEDTKSALGDEYFELLIANSGVVLAVKGFKNTDYKDLLALDNKLDELDKDSKVSCIIITVLAGNCTGAIYISGSASEVEAKIAKAMAE